MKKEVAKLIEATADELPVINNFTTETHFVKGSELIEQGHTEKEDGSPIDPEAMYKQKMPVLITSNHTNGMKRAFIKGGKKGVTEYIRKVRQMVEKDTVKS